MQNIRTLFQRHACALPQECAGAPGDFYGCPDTILLQRSSNRPQNGSPTDVKLQQYNLMMMENSIMGFPPRPDQMRVIGSYVLRGGCHE
eukprot:6180291-Pleurochrysis_carterae.AAC.1